MSDANFRKVRTPHLRQMKTEQRRIVMMTAYDALSAAWADEGGSDVILVGDSLGNTALGFRDTLDVTLDMMVHHCAAVARRVHRPLIVADLPFMSYKVSTEQAMHAATRLLQEGHAEAVKLEGGSEIAPTVAALVRAGIPVMAHLGLLPQSVHALGGYRTVGHDDAVALKLRDDAHDLQDAGAFAVVLEMIPHDLAERMTGSLAIPTIGIGAGPGCDGQVLVLSDVLGMTGRQPFSFVRQYANLYDHATEGLRQFAADVRECRFPEEASEESE